MCSLMAQNIQSIRVLYFFNRINFWSRKKSLWFTEKKTNNQTKKQAIENMKHKQNGKKKTEDEKEFGEVFLGVFGRVMCRVTA